MNRRGFLGSVAAMLAAPSSPVPARAAVRMGVSPWTAAHAAYENWREITGVHPIVDPSLLCLAVKEYGEIKYGVPGEVRPVREMEDADHRRGSDPVVVQSMRGGPADRADAPADEGGGW